MGMGGLGPGGRGKGGLVGMDWVGDDDGVLRECLSRQCRWSDSEQEIPLIDRTLYPINLLHYDDQDVFIINPKGPRAESARAFTVQ